MKIKLTQKILRIIKEEKGDSFTVLMTALSVNLLAFFVLLNSLATIEKDKVAKAVKSIRGSFGVLPADFKSLIGIKPKMSQGFKILAIPELEMRTLSRELEKFIMLENKGKDFGFFSSDQRTIISFSEKAGFHSGSAELEPSMLSVLDKIAEIIKKSDSSVHIRGHTDNIPITKKYPSNWELSSARAVNTLKYIIERGGIDPAKIAAAGFGDSKPLFANDTLKNRSRNRRVEIILLKDKNEF